MKKAFLSFAILAMILFSCTKPGPIGPTGPAGTNGTNGAAGTAGTAGTNGTNGTNGTDGNANINGTNTVALNSGSWIANVSSFVATFSTTAITQAIVDNGAVMVYEQSASFWLALPCTCLLYTSPSPRD